MKLGISLTAMHKWLFLGIAFCACIGVSPRIHAEEIISEGDYVTFSTLLNGKRYYLGVDTVIAKGVTPKDTVMAYEQPNYATMWQMGEDHTVGEIHMRTVKNVWLAERVEREKYLSLGTDKGNYSGLVLSDAEHATMWQLGTSDSESERYIEGYVYYFSDATGVDVYRYIKYDPLYGFGRAYSSRPQSPIRMSIWDRKTGDDLRFDFRPETHTFGLETEEDTTLLPLRAKVTFYENVDRFRSRDGRIDVFARVPTVIDNQATLIGAPYYLYMYYEWASNPRTEGQHIRPGDLSTIVERLKSDSYNGKSIMKYWNTYDHKEDDVIKGAWRDTTLMYIRNYKFERKEENTIWHDTMYTVGTSPFDRPEARFVGKDGESGEPADGFYVDHVDSLRVYFHCKGQMYRDAALVVRQTYHEQPFTTLNLNSSPSDYTFAYNEGAAKTFTVTGEYKEGSRILNANNTVVQVYEGERYTLDWTSMSGHDEDVDGTGNKRYDELIVDAINADGTACDWLTVTVNNKNQIQVKAKNNTTGLRRTAQIRYTLRYWHSSAIGDQPTTTRSIWIVQQPETAGSDELYSFVHKSDNGTDLQAVHEKYTTLYAIPGEDLSLPLHRDHWGYYRWFEYTTDKDIENTSTWRFTNEPKNNLDSAFMPINISTSTASHGRWDIMKDVNNVSNPKFTNDHFLPGNSTPVPAIRKDGEITALKVGCDVSAYYDVETSSSEGTPSIGLNLSSVTEPTLSYRQIFDIQPASIRANEMESNRSGDNWLEKKIIIAPTKRTLSLQPKSPIAANVTTNNEPNYDEEELQYIHYFNTTGTNDENMGDASGADGYNRIGKKRTTGTNLYKARLIPASELSSMPNGYSKKIVMVNPRKSSGYVLGKSGDGFTGRSIGGIADTATLRTFVENNILNPNGIANLQDAYILQLSKSGGNTFISHVSSKTTMTYSWQVIRYTLDWSSHWFQSNSVEIETYSLPADDARLTYSNDAVVRIKMGILIGNNHHLTASSVSSGRYTRDPHVVRDGGSEGSASNQEWIFYEIIAPEGVTEHYETPRWEKSTDNSSWTKVAEWNYSTNRGVSIVAGYTMHADGSLEIGENIHKNANETIYYRLRTEHFQLAKFTVVTRDADKEGPSERAIIPVETMLNEYEILFTLTSDNQIFPWDQSEMSFHYPTSYTAIREEQRVFVGDEPAKGEYAFMRSFRGIDAISGIGTTDYLLCLNAAEKPVQFMNFEFPQMSCSDQQLFFTAELCNPIRNAYNPQITAEMEGYNGSAWIPIYRYVTGELPYDDGKWYQLVMPIDQGSIAGYQKFRFKGYLSGSTESEAFVLMDHARFIAKERPLRIFQNKSTCLDRATNQIDIVARLDYQHGTYPAGTLFAFQYQKKSGDTYVPITTGGIPYVNDEGGTLTDNAGNACGLVRIPAKTHTPGSADSIKTLETLTPNGKCYVDEDESASTYYTMYLSRTMTGVVVNDTFRVAMAVIPDAATHPNFATAGCATERIVIIKNPIQLRIGGANWPNTVTESSAEGVKQTANATYRLDVTLHNAPEGSQESHCKFDMLRSYADDRDYEAKYRDWQTEENPTAKEEKKALVDAADALFRTTYGVTRSQLMDVLATFREDNEDNPLRLVSNWNDVRPEDFRWSGRRPEQADSIYRLLDRLITKERKLEIGLDSRDIFLGNAHNMYAYIQPLPASGWSRIGTDTTAISVCNTPQWFEIHSKPSDYVLRFGYDNIMDGTYQVPVIRATKTDANEHLKVRIAAITHNDETHSGVVIGWDSTYVVESNDPNWNSSKHFRYHQDRIVQDDRFANYYHVPTSGTEEEKEADEHRYVTFTPVTSEYITLLNNTDCDCYNYDASGTNTNLDGASGSVFVDKGTNDCNKWHVKPKTIDGHNAPGYQTPNNFTLKAGYWYKFKTAFFSIESDNKVLYDLAGDGTCRGHAEFIVAVAPDTVVWAPSHPDEANFWNDDDNWRAVDGTGKVLGGSIATIPMGDSKVIIPSPSSENLLPILRGDENTIGRRVDLTDYGFTANTCRDILFKPNATIWGQENLNYTKAYVDVPFRQGNWQTFSPALEGIYSGDIYIPQNAGSGDDPDFAPAKFEDGSDWSATHNRTYPYAFYQGYYNSSVSVAFQNTDEEGDPLETYTKTSTNSADWVRTNVLNQPLTPGKASIILGFGPRDEAEDSVLIVRLPKQETEYHYVGKKNGVYTEGSSTGTLTRAETQNLSYDKTKLGSSKGITYALTNAISNDIFFFGNPTMSLIDVYQLCEDNSGKLAGGGSHSYTIYQLQDGSAYTAQTVTGKGQHFIAPQRAVGLKASSANTSLSIVLKPDALVPMTGVEDAPPPSPAPQRGLHRTTEEEHRSARLYISAANESDGGLCKSFITIGEQSGASRGYQVGEDALNLSSGLNYYNAASFATPLSMYTIADNQALMIDVRDTVSMIPVVFKTLDAHYSYDELTILSFATEGQWSQPLYLYDAVTNDSVMILNGMQIGIQTPLSDQIRYYIGYSHSVVNHQPSEEGTVTGIENEPTINSSSEGRTCIYDLLGRKIMSLGEYDLISTISLPTGVYIIQRGNQTERMVLK